MLSKNIIDIVNNKKQIDNWVLDEAERCLSCYEPPCQQGCPANIPIPDFIRAIKSGNIKHAAKLVREANPLASICGEVCPEEVFCQSHCTRAQIDSPIKIRELHRQATSLEIEYHSMEKISKGTVAVIGSGPAGLTCAIQLAKNGDVVTIYEQGSFAGGVPAASIPKFRLADEAIESDIERAKALGIEIRLNSHIKKPAELLKKFAAVIMATGLPSGRGTSIPGSDLPQVLSALDFLNNLKEGDTKTAAGRRVIIIGGGNVSLDVAASAMEAGASEVHLLYRRGPIEMKVWRAELEEAQRRGVVIDYLVTPVEYVAEAGKLKAVKCIRTKLINEVDMSGRRKTEFLPGTGFELPADVVIEAIGLDSNYCKDIAVKPDLSTSIEGLFAGGDWARGEGTIVEAVRDGKLAAEKIIAYLKAQNL